MASVKAGELNLGEAKEVLGLGHRQIKRVWKRQDAAGAAGRAHGGTAVQADEQRVA
jgi:hypothetical protein